jgi:amidase
VVFPVSFVDPQKDSKVPLKKPYTALPGNLDAVYWDRYDPEEWAGMPVNLQVVGKRLQDEELLGLARVIRDAGATLH